MLDRGGRVVVRSALATLCVTGAALAAASSAFAAPGDLTASLQVRARVQASCSISLQDLDFGAYRAAAESNAKTLIEVRCTPGLAVMVALDGGGAGDVDERRMTGDGDLTYQLYVDSQRTRIFGDGTGGEMVSLASTGRWQRIDLYGSIPAGQSSTSGSYLDTVTMTLTY
jgi:spore coat protein U-like protein